MLDTFSRSSIFFFIWRVRHWKRRRREGLFNCFTPAGPVYAFLANLYSGLADVGRRPLCTILSPAFLCLSPLPWRTCSLAIVCLCAWQPGWLAWAGLGWPKEMCGRNANSGWLLGSSSSVWRCILSWTTVATYGDTKIKIITFFFLFQKDYLNLFVAPLCLTVVCLEAPSLCLIDKRSKQMSQWKINLFKLFKPFLTGDERMIVD